MLTEIRWNGDRYCVLVTDKNGDFVYLANYSSLSDARHAAFTAFNHGHVVDYTVQ